MTSDPNQKVSAIYPSGKWKASIVTFDCPRLVHDPVSEQEAREWGRSQASFEYRGRILRIKCETADALSMPFRIVRSSRDWVCADVLGPYAGLLRDWSQYAVHASAPSGLPPARG